MICAYCGTKLEPDFGIDVGSYWNNNPGTEWVCSDECHTQVKLDHKNYLYWRRDGKKSVWKDT